MINFLFSASLADEGVAVELPNGEIVIVTLIGDGTTEQGGVVVQNDDGTFSYTPPDDFSGTDTFRYLVEDERGASDVATVSIDVTPVSDTTVYTGDDADGSTDTVSGFLVGNAAQGADILDVSSVLQGENADNLSDYLTVSDVGGDVTILVDSDGAGDSVDLTIVLQGAGTGLVDLETLVANGQIIIGE